MTLRKEERELIKSYRQIGRTHRQLIWRMVKGGMQQRGLRIFFDH